MSGPKRIALILGGTKFTDTAFNPLPGAEPDCLAMERLLEKAGFEVRAFVGEKACLAGRVMEEVRQLAQTLRANDALVFYAALHGFELDGTQLLVCPEAQWIDIKHRQTRDAISVSWLEDVTAVPGVQRLFAFDACRTQLLRGRGVPLGSDSVVFTRSIDRDLLAQTVPGVTGDPDESPVAFLNACGSGDRAREMDDLGRGLFSDAFVRVVSEDLEAGRGWRVDNELVVRVRARMATIWRDAGKAGVLPQKPRLDGDPVVLVETTSPTAEVRSGTTFEEVKRRLESRNKEREPFEGLRRDYLRMAEDPKMGHEDKADLWRALCRDVGVGKPTTWPHDLIWGETTPRVVLRMGEPGKGAVFENALGMRFVPVPVSNDGTSKILASIWLTRWQDYAAYAKANPGVDETWRDPVWKGERVTPGSTHPVVAVSWKESVAFATWLTSKDQAEGRLPPDARYRLPTDAEWSWMVGIGEAEEQAGISRSPKEKDRKIKAGLHPLAFPWGPNWPPPKGTGNFEYRTIDGYDDGYATTSPVDAFRPNGFGLYDLSGNVSEWCEDRFDDSEIGSDYRVWRGGSWKLGYEPFHLLSSFRFFGAPRDRPMDCGFRLVLVGGAVV